MNSVNDTRMTKTEYLLPIATDFIAKFYYIGVFSFAGAHNERVEEENRSNQFTEEHLPRGDGSTNVTYSSL